MEWRRALIGGQELIHLGGEMGDQTKPDVREERGQKGSIWDSVYEGNELSKSWTRGKDQRSERKNEFKRLKVGPVEICGNRWEMWRWNVGRGKGEWKGVEWKTKQEDVKKRAETKFDESTSEFDNGV